MDFIQALSKHLTNSHTDESLRRAKICGGCEFKREGYMATFFESKIIEVNGFSCSLCKCPLATKIFAEDEKNICDKWLKK